MECERCKKELPLAQLRVDMKDKRLVCGNCLHYVKTGMLVSEDAQKEAKKDLSEVRKKLALSTAQRLDEKGEKKERYACDNCEFKFYRKENYQGLCPYCGEGQVKEYMPKSPVKDIDEMLK